MSDNTPPPHSSREVRVERLSPAEVEAATLRRPVVYLPLGSVEHHSHHLPLGVDGLNALGVCTRAAQEDGGVVLPPLWFGTGGTHTQYPWTIMTTDVAPIADLLTTTLRRLADLGVRLCVLFTGHFADEQLALIDSVATEWNAADSPLTVLALGVNRSDASVAPDHAGVFETALLQALAPDLVHLERLPTLDDVPRDPAGRDGTWLHREAPEHPLWGVMGPDPRDTDLEGAAELLREVVRWVRREVGNALPRG